jgi:phosphoribosylaminoimidazole (AIR) synthetase
MRLLGALGGLADDELRATFNGGLGMIAVVAPSAATLAIDFLTSHEIEAAVVGTVVPVADLGGRRYAEGALG